MDADSLADTVETYCEFDSDRVYILMAIARSKENQDINSNYCPVIRKVVTESNEIRRKLVELNHAVSRFEHRFRLYLSVNARNTIDATFSLKRDMDEWIQMRLHGNEDVMQKFKRLDSEFKSTLQSNKCKDESKFLFDLDEITADEANRFERKLKEDTTVILTRTTPNGHHIVTEPFNYTELDTGIDYEIKKDDLVFLSYLGEEHQNDAETR